MTETLDRPATLPARKNGSGGVMQRIDPRTPASDTATLKTLMEHQAEKLRMVLPKHLTPERLMRVVLVAVSKSDLLQKCSINSILQCVMTSAQLGLDCSGVLGSAYMVPFWNKNTNCHEAQLIPGYRGLIDLARRSGEIEDITAHCVYASDEFDLELGASPRMTHRPNLTTERRDEDIVGAYMVAYLKGNSRPHIEFVPRCDIDKVRRASRAKDKGPWVDWFPEMCRKTAVKRGIKFLPMSVELAEAIELDNDALGNTEVLSAQTQAGNGASRLNNRVAATQRPVSAGQQLVDPETGEEIQTPQIEAASDLQSHSFDRPESKGQSEPQEPDIAGAEAEPPAEAAHVDPRDAKQKFWDDVRDACESAELKHEKDWRNRVKKWALKNALVGKEHAATPEQIKALFDAILKREGYFA